MTKSGVTKLGDMNVSKIVQKGLSYTQTGTPYYASPEVWKEKPYDKKSDIWSLGCVLYEAVMLQPPFRGPSMEAIYERIMECDYPKIHTQFSKDLGVVIKKLLQVNPHKRPTCEEILEFPEVKARMKRLLNKAELSEDEEPIEEDILLKTIKCPKNL